MRRAILTLCLITATAGCAADPVPSVDTALPATPAPASATPAPTSTTPAPTSTTPVPPSSAPAPSTTPSRAGTTKARPLDPAPTPTDPECSPGVVLPVAKRVADDPAAGLKVESVEIPACRNGYARVFTVPARTPQRFEGDQLFLRLVDGGWKLVGRGASIDCGDDGLTPAVTAACTALR